jgi:hypothetical protein
MSNTPEAPTDIPETPGDEAMANQYTAYTTDESLTLPKDLEALRFGVRGNDEAVQEVGTEVEQHQLGRILTNPGSHTRDELLGAIFDNYSGEAYGNNQWVKKIVAWGDSPEVVTAYGALMDAHPEWSQLSLDPGFMTHLPAFMDMLDRGEITATDYEGVRQQLKDKLGNKTVWRGTMLTDDELEEAKTEGLGSPLSRVVQGSEQPREQFEASALSAQPIDTIEKHFHGEHAATPYLSVSEHPEVAIAVGRHFGNRVEGKKFFLFELSVPAIDLVSYTDHAIRPPFKLREMKDRNPDIAITVGVNGKQSTHKWDDSVESFVHWKIDPTEIHEITKPDISESSWNKKITGTLAA